MRGWRRMLPVRPRIIIRGCCSRWPCGVWRRGLPLTKLDCIQNLITAVVCRFCRVLKFITAINIEKLPQLLQLRATGTIIGGAYLARKGGRCLPAVRLDHLSQHSLDLFHVLGLVISQAARRTDHQPSAGDAS